MTPHCQNARDLEFFVKYLGFTPGEAIRCATQYGGQIMMKPGELGLVKEGFLADLLLVDGDPMAFVISKNLRRRHLSDGQRASVAAKIANLARGRPAIVGAEPENPPIGGISAERAAEIMHVAPRQVERARVVHDAGIEPLREALHRGEIAVSAAERIARLPEDQQPAELVKALPNGARAVMASRQEPGDR